MSSCLSASIWKSLTPVLWWSWRAPQVSSIWCSPPSIMTDFACLTAPKGISGSRERRPALDNLWSLCRKRLVDAVVVYRYDRFARSLRQLVNALEEFRALGVDFISIHEGVDTSTPNGRLVFGIFASIAEFERELIRDRVRSGLAAARAKGRQLGRPRVEADAKRIASLRDSGASWRTISHEVGISVRSVRRLAGRCGKNLSESQPTNP
jgi:DNA invertase Pin-like site-specific DNA recombinase